MIVTDRDAIIADYAVSSYAKIPNLPFRLRVYSNWLMSNLKAKHFPRWRTYPFVDIVDHEWQTDSNKPTDPRLQGPYERCATIWDRELKHIDTPYHATVDADFEILDGSFVRVMIERLDSDPRLIAMSTDYAPKRPSVFDTYSQEVICLNERWETWFCIYRREALSCNVSHSYREESLPGPIRRNVWDDSGYLQRTLKQTYGYDLAVVDRKFQSCFIHYGAFSQNRHIDENNVAWYRRLQIAKKCGGAFTRKASSWLETRLFRQVDRSTFAPGWNTQEPPNSQSETKGM
jgi:hypothetical protein